MRCKRWNVMLVAVEAGLSLWAHAVGVSWLSLGLLFAGLALAGWAGFAYLVRVQVPRAQRGYERQLRIAPAEWSVPAGPALLPAPEERQSASEGEVAGPPSRSSRLWPSSQH